MQLFLDAVTQGVGGCRFTMGDECHARWLGEATQPTHDLVDVAMSGKHVQVPHLGANWNVVAMHLDALGASNHRCPAGAARLKPGKQNSILRIGRVAFKMMQDTASRRHSARRY